MGFARQIRLLTERILERRGYTLRPKFAPPRGFTDFLSVYREAGPEPAVVFDIGVGKGTPWLYQAFPKAHFVLVEALRDFADEIEKICTRYDAEIHYCALSEQEGEVAIHVPVNGATGSSLLARNLDWANHMASTGDRGTIERRVPVSTLDSITGDNVRSHVVKIDVEGAELQVMRGGQKCIASADMIIVECAVATRHAGESGFINIGWHLQQEGFTLVDIVEMSTYGQYGTLAYLDAIFINNANPFLRQIASSH